MRYQDEASAEREKAALDLFLEVGIYGPEDTFVDSLQILRPQAAIGLSYSPATGLEQVAAEKAFISTQIKHLEKIIELNRQLIDSAEEKASEEAKLDNQGRNVLTNVI